MLMSSSYANLRSAIYSNQDELMRFRQLLVNTVMATDIMDKDLGAARKERWNKAFSSEGRVSDECPIISTNRKATIVIEHLIQVSYVPVLQAGDEILSAGHGVASDSFSLLPLLVLVGLGCGPYGT